MRGLVLRVVTSLCVLFVFFFSSRRRHTRCSRDWSSDVCSSDLYVPDFKFQSTSGLFEQLKVRNVAKQLPFLGLAQHPAQGAQGVVALGRRAGKEIGRASCRERV